jgi:hypothetical protein
VFGVRLRGCGEDKGRGEGRLTFFTCGVEVDGFEEVVHCLEPAWGRRVLHMVVVVVLGRSAVGSCLFMAYR